MRRSLPLLAALNLFAIIIGLAAAPSLRSPGLAGFARSSMSYFTVRSVMAAPTSGYSAKLEQTQYRNWNVYKLSNGLISLYVAPELGGRAIQLQLGDHEFFFVNKALEGKVLPESQNNLQAGWANYGGDKVWPGPEGWMSDAEWVSIPYYILDGAAYQAEVATNTPAEVAIRVTSPQDPRTGTQFTRTFHVYADTTRIKVDQVMRNISRREIRWGIWHLIQNDAADANDPSKPNPDLYMYIPLNPHSKYPEGYYKPYGDARHPSYEVLPGGRMLKIHYLYRVCKAAADSSAGWYAVVNGQKNIGLVENFKYFPDQEYPDGASVETMERRARDYFTRALRPNLGGRPGKDALLPGVGRHEPLRHVGAGGRILLPDLLVADARAQSYFQRSDLGRSRERAAHRETRRSDVSP